MRKGEGERLVKPSQIPDWDHVELNLKILPNFCNDEFRIGGRPHSGVCVVGDWDFSSLVNNFQIWWAA